MSWNVIWLLRLTRLIYWNCHIDEDTIYLIGTKHSIMRIYDINIISMYIYIYIYIWMNVYWWRYDEKQSFLRDTCMLNGGSGKQLGRYKPSFLLAIWRIIHIKHKHARVWIKKCYINAIASQRRLKYFVFIKQKESQVPTSGALNYTKNLSC